MNKPSIFFPLVLIIVGALWFLRATDILPPSYIILAIALCVAGVLVLILDLTGFLDAGLGNTFCWCPSWCSLCCTPCVLNGVQVVFTFNNIFIKG